MDNINTTLPSFTSSEIEPLVQYCNDRATFLYTLSISSLTPKPICSNHIDLAIRKAVIREEKIEIMAIGEGVTEGCKEYVRR